LVDEPLIQDTGSARPDARRRLGACAVLFIALAALQGCAQRPAPASALALWNTVDAACNQGRTPGPSVQCNPLHHDAVLKDRCGTTHYLLIPTARRAGIESPELLQDEEPDYFADAWAARAQVIAASGRSDVASDEIGLAVNSRRSRAQEQLHIHIDFVRPEVRGALRQWLQHGASSPNIELLGHAYRIVHVATLQQPTPFQRAAAAGEPERQRALNTIAVIGDGDSGFYLLFGRADLLKLDCGHAEQILVPKRCAG
jgi:CDP-diacylglycerol pyrophosphatase